MFARVETIFSARGRRADGRSGDTDRRLPLRYEVVKRGSEFSSLDIGPSYTVEVVDDKARFGDGNRSGGGFITFSFGLVVSLGAEDNRASPEVIG